MTLCSPASSPEDGSGTVWVSAIHGRPLALLLPEFPVPRLRPPRRRKRTVTSRLGKNRQYGLLYCRSCRARCSERKGTPLYRAHLPEEKVASIREHITEGCGVLKTARLVKVHPDTVTRYTRAAGAHARAAHDELVARSPETREIQMDEAWSFVAKNEKNCDEDEPEDRFHGDCWDHAALDPEHRLVVSVVPGERPAGSVQELVSDVKERLGGHPRC